MLDNYTVAKRIKEKRIELNMSQKELAEKTGLTGSAISAYEKGAKMPVLQSVYNIAEVLGVSIDWLCGKNDPKKESATLKDIAIHFMEIDKRFRVDICEDVTHPYSPISDFTFQLTSRAVDEKQHHFCRFIDSWKKFKELHENKTIDDEVFELWAEKELNKLSSIGLYDGASPEYAEDLPF